VTALKYALLGSQWSYGHFLKPTDSILYELRQRLVATWDEFQHSMVYYMRLISVEKDWKHVLTQKVVTVNTCCDTACLTFHLPHITTSSFHSHRRQPTTGCVQSLQRLKERTQTFSQMKKFCNLQVSVVTFQVRWASGLQFVFFYKININNQNYVWKILFKMAFWISQGKVVTSDGQGAQV